MNIKIGQNEFTLPFTVKLENGLIVDADGRDLFEDEEAAAKAVADALNDYWREIKSEADLPEDEGYTQEYIVTIKTTSGALISTFLNFDGTNWLTTNSYGEDEVYSTGQVIAWRPLPKPFTPEKPASDLFEKEVEIF